MTLNRLLYSQKYILDVWLSSEYVPVSVKKVNILSYKPI